MNLQEHHREFAVKCFAEYMQRSDVAHAFMQEFEHDLPKPPQHSTRVRNHLWPRQKPFVLRERTEGGAKTRKHGTWHTQNYFVIQQVRAERHQQ